MGRAQLLSKIAEVISVTVSVALAASTRYETGTGRQLKAVYC